MKKTTQFRILIASEFASEGVERLKSQGYKVFIYRFDDAKKPAQESAPRIIQKIDPHAIIVRSKPLIGEEEFRAAGNLRIVVRAGIGINNINLKAAERHGVQVSNTPGSNTNSVAELTIGLMINLLRNITKSHIILAQGGWAKDELCGSELREKTIGILGYGKVGRRVAEILRVFNSNIIIYDPFVKEVPEGMILVDLKTLLSQSNIITIHAELTPETQGLLDTQAFSLMQRGVFLINAARGSIIDAKALLDALHNKKLSGAALDVYNKEPPPTELVRELASQKTVLTAHLGSESNEAQRDTALLAAQTVIDKLSLGLISNAIGIPYLDQKTRKAYEAERDLRKSLTCFITQCFNKTPIGIQTHFFGDFPDLVQTVFTRSVVASVLGVPYEQANIAAENRGVLWHKTHKTASYRKIGITLRGNSGQKLFVAGRIERVGDDTYPVLTNCNEFTLGGVRMRGIMLFAINRNVPGAWHKITGVLASQGLNLNLIASNEKSSQDDAHAFVLIRINETSLETKKANLILKEIRHLPEVMATHIIDLN